MKEFNPHEVLMLKDNQSFVKAMTSSRSIEEVQRVFKDYGVEISEVETAEILDAAMDDELCINDLELISAGGIGGDVYTACRNTCVFLVSWCYHSTKNAWNVIRSGGKK